MLGPTSRSGSLAMLPDLLPLIFVIKDVLQSQSHLSSPEILGRYMIPPGESLDYRHIVSGVIRLMLPPYICLGLRRYYCRLSTLRLSRVELRR